MHVVTPGKQVGRWQPHVRKPAAVRAAPHRDDARFNSQGFVCRPGYFHNPRVWVNHFFHVVILVFQRQLHYRLTVFPVQVIRGALHQGFAALEALVVMVADNVFHLGAFHLAF